MGKKSMNNFSYQCVFLVIFASIISLSVSANDVVLQGRVYNSVEGILHGGVKLTLTGEKPKTVITDKLGFYRFEKVKPGPRLIKIELDDDIIIGRVLIQQQAVTLKNLDIGNIEHPNHHHDY